jgi:hypothetical protein
LSKEEGASAQDIARALKLDKSAGWRRLSAACDEGFVVNLEERKGRPGKYRRTAQGVEGTSILPTTEDVRTAYQTPQKTAQPCNGEENAESDQEDDDCNEACIPEDNRVSPIATECRLQPECERLSPSLATVKPPDSNGKSPPVAALQAFSGGRPACTVARQSVPAPAKSRCALPATGDWPWSIRTVWTGGCIGTRRNDRHLGCRRISKAGGPSSSLTSGDAMSALPPKADMCSAQVDVRFVPIAAILMFNSITSSPSDSPFHAVCLVVRPETREG